MLRDVTMSVTTHQRHNHVGVLILELAARHDVAVLHVAGHLREEQLAREAEAVKREEVIEVARRHARQEVRVLGKKRRHEVRVVALNRRHMIV